MPPTLRRLLPPLLCFLLAAAWVAASGRLRGGFRIDEGNKVGETYCLRLLEQGRVADPDWFSDVVERTNPPVGKVLFGLAVEAAGLDLPHDLTVARATTRGEPPPSAYLPAYTRLLFPIRLFVLFATAATAAGVFALARSAAGSLAGFLASIIYMTSFLPLTFSATAIFDPLLALFVVAAALPVATLSAKTPNRSALLRTAAAAMIAALAFQTRLTGLVALAGIWTLLAIYGAYAHRLRRAMLLCTFAGLVCLVTGTVLNPFYWSVPKGPPVAPELRTVEPLPLRVVHRYAWQLRDLRSLAEREIRIQGHRLGGREKLGFTVEYIFGDWSGAVIFIGLLLVLTIPILERTIRPDEAAVLAWSVAVAVTIIAWLPLAYPRYLLVTVPGFAVAAAFGWSKLVHGSVALVREQRLRRRVPKQDEPAP